MIDRRYGAALVAAMAMTVLSGCNIGSGSKGESGVFQPTAISSPPSVRGTSGNAEAPPKAEARSAQQRRLNVPRQVQ